MNENTALKGWGLGITTALTLGLVVLADVLFFNQPVGWTLGLFAAALIVAMLLLHGNRLTRPITVALAITAALTTAALIEHPGTLPIIMAYLAVVSLAIALRGRWKNHVRTWCRRWLEYTVLGWLRAFVDVRLFTRRFAHPQAVDRPRRFRLRHWLFPIALGAVFIGLLSWANPIISRWTGQWLETLGDWILDFFSEINPIRILLWIAVLLWSWGLLRYRTNVRRPRSDPTSPEIHYNAPFMYSQHDSTPISWTQLRDRLLDPIVVTRCLILFNFIFAVQTALDLTYLYVNGGAIALPEGLTHGEYARRGAYPLVATALLASLFVLITFRQSADQHRSVWARRLVYLWLAQNLLLIVSAAVRLIYVSVYSLTRLRVASAIWMALVLLGFLFIFIRIATRRSNAWLVGANTLAAVIVLLACSFVNFDGLIANFNVQHCKQITANTDAAWLGPV